MQNTPHNTDIITDNEKYTDHLFNIIRYGNDIEYENGDTDFPYMLEDTLATTFTNRGIRFGNFTYIGMLQIIHDVRTHELWTNI